MVNRQSSICTRRLRETAVSATPAAAHSPALPFLAYNPAGMVRLRNIPASWLITPLVLLFFWLAVNSLVGDSPTMDEQNHLARGLAFLRTGDPRLSLEHPPLVNALSALPAALLLDVKLPLDDPSWTELSPPDVYWYVFAEQMMWHSGNNVTLMIFLARLPIVFLLLGLALTGYHFARLMWGRTAAPVVFALLLFDPNLLAHGRYTTTDMGGTVFIFLATFALWKWSMVNDQLSMVNGRSPVNNWRLTINHWLFASLAMGLAFGSKLLALLFVPIWGLLALLPLYPGWEGRELIGAARRLGRFIAAGLLSIGVVWLVFGLEWREFRFQAEVLQGLNQFSGPMPTLWAGLEQIALLTGQGRYEAFMAGRFSADGFAGYFPFAFAVKTPLLVLFLFVLAMVWLLSNGRTRRRALFLTIPILAYFLFSSQSALNIGYRHLLPVLPFVYLLIGGLWAGVAGGEWRVAGRWVAGVTAVILLLHIATTLAIHPHYLSYFNREVGGPANGYRLLLDSNVDWGQDLLRLQQWMADNDVPQVKLGWFGTADPNYYGLNYEPLPGFPRQPFYGLWTHPPFNQTAPEPGVYAISANSLWEMPLPEGQKYVYAWFRDREPDGRVGYSILIYDLR